MADHDDEAPAVSAAAGSAVEKSEPQKISAGTAVIPADPFENPGEPPHRLRMTDKSPAEEQKAARQVSTLFFASVVFSVLAVAAYIAFPIRPGDTGSIRLNNLFLGLGIALGLLSIGIGAVHWSKTLMPAQEITEMRHLTRGSDVTRAKAAEVFELGNKESGFGRRALIRNSLFGAMVAFILPGVVIFRDLGPKTDPNVVLKHTIWKEGMHLTLDPFGTRIKASDVTLGSAFHVIPEALLKSENLLEEKAKAAVLLMRLNPADLHEPAGRENWQYNGIVAYSKICTHVGCPVALYEQQTHHLLCPCHQSTFDVTENCKVIFGPASRPLPQLPITVDADGYLIAQSDFHEPVGPSFWEREK